MTVKAVPKRRQKMFLASVGLSREPRGAATRTVPISVFSGGGPGVACEPETLWEAQGALCDCRPIPVGRQR